MANDTSIPMSFENRNQLRDYKDDGEETWDEFFERVVRLLDTAENGGSRQADAGNTQDSTA